MTKALAFDQATVTGWTFGGTKIELPEWVSGHFRANKRPLLGERLNLVQDGALALIDKYGPDLIVYETPFDPTFSDMKRGTERVQFNRNTMNFLQRVAGAIEMAAARRAIPIEDYGPRTWRSALKLPSAPHPTLEDIKAKAEVDGDEPVKPASRTQWVKKLTFDKVRSMGACVETTDEADSWGLCFYALHGEAGSKRATDDLFARVLAKST